MVSLVLSLRFFSKTPIDKIEPIVNQVIGSGTARQLAVQTTENESNSAFIADELNTEIQFN